MNSHTTKKVKAQNVVINNINIILHIIRTLGYTKSSKVGKTIKLSSLFTNIRIPPQSEFYHLQNLKISEIVKHKFHF